MIRNNTLSNNRREIILSNRLRQNCFANNLSKIKRGTVLSLLIITASLSLAHTTQYEIDRILNHNRTAIQSIPYNNPTECTCSTDRQKRHDNNTDSYQIRYFSNLDKTRTIGQNAEEMKTTTRNRVLRSQGDEYEARN